MAQKNSPYRLALSIITDGKGIPYWGDGQQRPDGTANFGFKNLKQSPALIDDIPELQDDLLLYELVKAINRPECGLFTVGCGRWKFQEQQGHRVGGYIEVAFNSVEMVDDASRYFPLFFHYDRYLEEINFDAPVQIEWELTGAVFLDADVTGFTVAIWINTPFVSSEGEAISQWEHTIDTLILYLGSILEAPGTKIYP